MTNPANATWNVTGAGGIAVALMVGAFVLGIAAGQNDPHSWIGEIINLPFGVSIYISLIVALFTVVGAVSSALGWPFFTKAPDA